MRKIILSFSFLSVIFPAIVGATYTRTPSGVTTSTKFTFESTNPASDFSGWNGSGSSWEFNLYKINDVTEFDITQCFTGAGTTSDITAATMGFSTGTQISAVGYRQWLSGNCTSGGLNNGTIEGSAGANSSIFEFNEVVSTSSVSSSTCYTGLCMFSTSTDAALGNIFKMSEILLTFGLVLLIASIIYKFVNRNKK